MLLYEIDIPERSNSDLYYGPEHQQFEDYLLQSIGGFKRYLRAIGKWQGPDRVYVDSILTYRFGCERGQEQQVVQAAQRLFPDQLAFALATIGTLEIIET